MSFFFVSVYDPYNWADGVPPLVFDQSTSAPPPTPTPTPTLTNNIGQGYTPGTATYPEDPANTIQAGSGVTWEDVRRFCK